MPAYLINGEDELKRETVLKRLHARIAKLGDIDFNHDVFHGESASGDDIVSACNTVPFASDVRLVVVHAADALKKSDAEALVTYLSEPSPSTVLCLWLVSSRRIHACTRLLPPWARRRSSTARR
ncbi:MAG: DNA polymerase III subunit delta [Eggerthellaceae bacterium]